jgi:CBS domain-containing protein
LQPVSHDVMSRACANAARRRPEANVRGPCRGRTGAIVPELAATLAHRMQPVEGMDVGELLTHPAVTCRATDSLATAAQRMWDHDCGALPVVGEGDGLVGIITDRDICMATLLQGRAPHEIPVETAMARHVVSVRPDHHLADAEELMISHRVRRLPVVGHDGRVVGILSLDDLARHAALPASHLRHGADRVVRVLASIGGHG